jgi:2-C-methyl-D-erythritol 2,4-cyclodiphosphate synthase
MDHRVGTGFDVHRLKKGRNLVLGGLIIPSEKGLDGHSDADVLVHAIIDAMLGAAGNRDIGYHFPDTEEQYRDISSMELLKRTDKILKKMGYRVNNLDTTIMAQSPGLSPYIQSMRENIGKTLDIDPARIGVKATTTECLGFVGREEGMAAQAIVSIVALEAGEEIP